MNRRSMLQWLSSLLAAASASLVAIPGLGYLLSSTRRQRPSKSIVQRVARLDDLSPGKPVLVNVVGAGSDAWTALPEQVLGRVWLLRAADASDDREPVITALTALCPHLGCTIQLDSHAQQFVCPCHRAAFSLSGEKMAAKQSGEKNHAPRSMDTLNCRLVRDEVDDQWWVEVEFAEFETGLSKKVCKA